MAIAAFGPTSTADVLIKLWEDKGFDARELAALHGVPEGGQQDDTRTTWDNNDFKVQQADKVPKNVYRFESDMNMATQIIPLKRHTYEEFARDANLWHLEFSKPSGLASLALPQQMRRILSTEEPNRLTTKRWKASPPSISQNSIETALDFTSSSLQERGTIGFYRTDRGVHFAAKIRADLVAAIEQPADHPHEDERSFESASASCDTAQNDESDASHNGRTKGHPFLMCCHQSERLHNTGLLGSLGALIYPGGWDGTRKRSEPILRVSHAQTTIDISDTPGLLPY
ncbi:hypothetical protein AC578_5448 [Pseudocercospora eumusae]|nr:hypothetical protein AC578_5448 [Pseudocercospora eumusae]